MARLRLAALTLLAAGVAWTAVASAAPITGSTHVSSTADPPIYLFFSAPDCPFVPHAADLEAQTSSLTITTDGWLGPVQDENTNPNQQVLLRTHVRGTVEDASGNLYNAEGTFLDSSIHYLFNGDLLFDGTGTMTLAGPAGTVTGDVEFRNVTAPPDYSFTFTNIRHCDIRG
jgi:hypothetical protein